MTLKNTANTAKKPALCMTPTLCGSRMLIRVLRRAVFAEYYGLHHVFQRNTCASRKTSAIAKANNIRASRVLGRCLHGSFERRICGSGCHWFCGRLCVSLRLYAVFILYLARRYRDEAFLRLKAHLRLYFCSHRASLFSLFPDGGLCEGCVLFRVKPQ